MAQFNCSVCGRFISHEKGQVVVREVAPSDYWNGIDEVLTAHCEKHLPSPKEE